MSKVLDKLDNGRPLLLLSSPVVPVTDPKTLRHAAKIDTVAFIGLVQNELCLLQTPKAAHNIRETINIGERDGERVKLFEN